MATPIEFFKAYQDLLTERLLDNPMSIIVLAFIPATLAISYPLILQIINRLDDKYESKNIIQSFKSEWPHYMFRYALAISTLLAVMQFMSSWLITTMAFISVSILLIVFFEYSRRIIIYLDGGSLLKHLSRDMAFVQKRGYDDLSDKKIQRYKSKILLQWDSIIDLFHHAIKSAPQGLDYEICDDFIYPTFRFFYAFGEEKDNYLIFPDTVLKDFYEINLSYIKVDDIHHFNRLSEFTGSIFLNDSQEPIRFIHNSTYLTIWKNLILLIENHRYNELEDYWSRALSFIELKLKQPNPKFNPEFEETSSSQLLREKFAEEKIRFLQFHTVLCAYLFYKKAYKTLENLWFYTNSWPVYNYPLIVNDLSEIFKLYITFSSPSLHNRNFAIPYWFKNVNLDEMSNKLDVKFLVRKYAILLFLKQWRNDTDNRKISVKKPVLSNSLSEKEFFKNSIDFFARKAQEMLDDKELTNGLGLDHISQERYEENGLKYPIEFLMDLKIDTEIEIEDSLANAPLSGETINTVKENTKAKIEKLFASYSLLNGEDISKEDRDPISVSLEAIPGANVPFDKEAFIANPRTEYIDLEDFFLSYIFFDFRSHIAMKFMQNTKSQILIGEGEFFKAIAKLDLNPVNHIIIVFGRNLDYDISYYKEDINVVKEDERYTFNDVEILSYPAGYVYASNSIFILSKSDLPMLRSKPFAEVDNLRDDEKAYWTSLDDPISTAPHLYFRVEELKKLKERFKHYSDQGRSIDELNNQVEVIIDFIINFWFRKDAFLLRINEARSEEENPVNIDELDTFESYYEAFQEALE